MQADKVAQQVARAAAQRQGGTEVADPDARIVGKVQAQLAARDMTDFVPSIEDTIAMGHAHGEFQDRDPLP